MALESSARAQHDAYMRVRPMVPGQTRQSASADNPRSLLFVDVESDTVDVQSLVDAFSQLPQRMTNTRYLLVRWPRITAAGTEEEETALDAATRDWADAISEQSNAIGYGQIHIGVIRFRVGKPAKITWNGGVGPEETGDSHLLQRALRVELATLLDWGHGIWRPQGYHYQLPSGEHSGTFIRLGDAFRSPRDVRVISSWLTPRLRDRMGFIAESATLVPLITDLQAVMRKRNWRANGSEMLDEYPRTRLDVMRAVRSMQAATGGVLGLVSVSASGRFRDLIQESLQTTAPHDEHWSMVVLVDKDGHSADTEYTQEPSGAAEQRVSTWLGLGANDLNPLDEALCNDCRSNERAQVVHIDPRSFEAMALPAVEPVTPDVGAARASLGFWEACHLTDAVGVELMPAGTPSSVSRPKSDPMGIRIDFDALLSEVTDRPTLLVDKIGEALEAQNKRAGENGKPPLSFKGVHGLIMSTSDDRPGVRETLMPYLIDRLGLGDLEPVFIAPTGPAPDEVSQWKRALVFSLGSVSGWNMRQLHLAVEARWKGQQGHEASGLVLHARPASEREWVSLQRPFRNQLHAVWKTLLPWRSPLTEEVNRLNELRRPIVDSLSPAAKDFLAERKAYCMPRTRGSWVERVKEFEDDPDDVPDPTSLLWGTPPRGGSATVRTQSNFGFEVGPVTAYAAMGAAMHAARQQVRSDDPRRRVFELPAITRSYYDGMLLACVLRWCEPQEAWWGETGRRAENVMTELIARTQDDRDKKILFPELLLATAQGKVPLAASRALVNDVQTMTRDWTEHDRAPVELGLALMQESGHPVA